jgi:hypothetical protein
MYEMNDDIVTLVFRTFNSVFPHVEIWDPGSGDVILLGAMRPWKSSLEVYGRAFARDEVRKDLEKIALMTPELFWARQLASQRTAFAIPGPGGIQSDGFPVLEYEAPKAFYIGASSQVLMQFDERTWQSDLAPAPKKAALANLDPAQLKRTFEDYSSVNRQLVQYLFANGSGLTEDAQSGGLPMPCIFSPTNAPASTPTVAENASKELKTLSDAERALGANPAQWRESVAAVEGVLAAQARSSPATAPDWSATHFGAFAARTCLNQGDYERAKTLVALGLAVEPASQILQYVGRIAERGPVADP